jgi:branched-chain amino acid transport system permease protein
MLAAVAIVLDGLVYASWLFMVAAGLTLIYGVMRILNIAHGSLYALGAYAAASLVGVYFAGGYAPLASYGLLVVAAIGVGVVFGLLIERGVLRWMYGRDEVLMVLVTYALFLILEDVIKVFWGVDPYFAFQPYGLLGIVEVLGLPYAVYDFLLIGVAVVVGIAVWTGLNRTRIGKLLIAVIHDREMSAAFGINVTAVFTATFIVGATLGAFGGALTAPKISVVPGMGVEVIVLAFAVVVIGGLGSIGGAIIGALLVGFARAAAVHLFPEAELFVIYGVMSLVLAVRPHGLFARPEARKI